MTANRAIVASRLLASVATLSCVVSVTSASARTPGVPTPTVACEVTAGNDRPCPDSLVRWSNPINRPDPAAGRDGLTQLVVVDDETAVGIGWTATDDGGTDWALVGLDVDSSTPRWSTMHGSPRGEDRIMDAALTPDGDLLIVVGALSFSGPGFDYPFEGDPVVAAFNPEDGSLVWIRHLSLGGPGIAYSVAIRPDLDGDGAVAFVASTVRVAATGYFETDAVVSALRLKDQELLWQIQHDDPDHAGNPPGPAQHDVAQDVLLSPDFKQLFVATESEGTASLDFLALALETETGEQLWRRRYNGPIGGGDHVEAAGISDNGQTLVLAGWLQGYTNETTGTNFDFGTVAISTSNGELQWSRTYSGAANEGQNVAFDLVVDSERVYVAGPASSADYDQSAFADYDYSVVSYNLRDGTDALSPVQFDGGHRLWDVATTLSISPGGGELYVSGFSQTVPGSVRSLGSTRLAQVGPLAVEPTSHAQTIAVDTTTGAIRWAGQFNGSDPPVDHDRVWSAAVTPDGSTLLLGATLGQGIDETWDAMGFNQSDIGVLGYRLTE